MRRSRFATLSPMAGHVNHRAVALRGRVHHAEKCEAVFGRMMRKLS
jgi:hypothetical protein